MKTILYFILITFAAYSCGSPAPKQEVIEVVVSPVEMYNNYVKEKADSCMLFKEDIELCKSLIVDNSWQKEILDSNSTHLLLTLISYHCDYPQNAFFLRYEQMVDDAPIYVSFRNGDFDFSLDVNLICGYLDSSALNEISDYVLKYHVEEKLNYLLKSKYIIVAQNKEFTQPIVDPNGTYTDGYSKEKVYIYDREANKMFYAFTYEATMLEKVSYTVEEGSDDNIALRTAVYESFQRTICINLQKSFNANNIGLTCSKYEQFEFNYTLK